MGASSSLLCCPGSDASKQEDAIRQAQIDAIFSLFVVLYDYQNRKLNDDSNEDHLNQLILLAKGDANKVTDVTVLDTVTDEDIRGAYDYVIESFKSGALRYPEEVEHEQHTLEVVLDLLPAVTALRAQALKAVLTSGVDQVVNFGDVDVANKTFRRVDLSRETLKAAQDKLQELFEQLMLERGTHDIFPRIGEWLAVVCRLRAEHRQALENPLRSKALQEQDEVRTLLRTTLGPRLFEQVTSAATLDTLDATTLPALYASLASTRQATLMELGQAAAHLPAEEAAASVWNAYEQRVKAAEVAALNAVTHLDVDLAGLMPLIVDAPAARKTELLEKHRQALSKVETGACFLPAEVDAPAILKLYQAYCEALVPFFAALETVHKVNEIAPQLALTPEQIAAVDAIVDRLAAEHRLTVSGGMMGLSGLVEHLAHYYQAEGFDQAAFAEAAAAAYKPVQAAKQARLLA